MERTRLSSNRVFLKISTVVAGVWFAIQSFQPFDLTILICGIVGVGYLCYIAFFEGDKIEFDETYMYIVYKDGETPVELRNVFYVARRCLNGGRSWGLGRIQYRYEGKAYSTQFHSRYFSKAYKQFTSELLDKNPNADINFLGI
jgi:hypothetical protein